MPKYSFILPVRNGSNHIRKCIGSILSQSYREFELIVLENASTDDTLEIIASFADNRIRVHSSATALTIEQNWQRVLEVQKGEFITLTGHDDLFDEDYLLTMHNLIAEHPAASLYQAHFRYIDSTGKTIRKCQPMDGRQSPPELVHNFLCGKTDLMGTGFMMRSKDYDDVGGIPPYPNLLFADMQLWIDLGKKSYMAVSPHECFAFRVHNAATTASSADSRMLKAFDELVDYFALLAGSDPALAPVIRKDSSVLLQQYCQGLTHRILRTPHRERKVPSLVSVIDQFRAYARKLGNTEFEPLDYKEIRMGRLVDSNKLLHALFLLMKKIYKKPILGRSV